MPYNDDDLEQYVQQASKAAKQPVQTQQDSDEELAAYVQQTAQQHSELAGMTPAKAWAAESPADIAKARSFLKEEAKAKLKSNPSWMVPSVTMPVAARMTSFAARPLGAFSKDYTRTADYMQRFADSFSEAREELELERGSGPVKRALKRGAVGAASSAIEMGLAAPAGPYAIYGTAAAFEANSAITDARNAGLKESAVLKHAITRGAIEGGIGAMFQKAGLGGIEKIWGGKAAAAIGTQAGLKQAGIATIVELPEEWITALGHSLAKVADKVDPKATSPGQLAQTFFDTTIQTLMLGGATAAPAVPAAAVQAGLDLRARGATTRIQKILNTAKEGLTPTRKQWKSWGLDPEKGKTAEGRKQGVQEVAQALQEQLEQQKVSQEAPVEATQPEAPQAATEQTAPTKKEWDVFKVGKETIVKNPTDADIRDIIKRFNEAHPNAPKGTVKVRNTFDASGNKYSWIADKTHSDIEPAINRKFNTTTNQNEYIAAQSAVQEVAGQLSTEPELAQAHPEVVEEGLKQIIEPMQPAPDSAPEITSIKNQIVTELRAKRSEAPATKQPPETWEEWLDQAAATASSDPTAGFRLVADLLKQPKSLDKHEVALAQIHYRTLENQFAQADESLITARQSNDPLAVKSAEARSQYLLDELRKAEQAWDTAGTEQARAFGARKIMLRQDYSPAALIRRASVSKGSLLSQAEQDQIRELSAKVTTMQAELDRLNEAVSTQDVDAAVEAAIKQAAPKKRFAKRTPSLKKVEAQKHVQEAWAEFKSKLGPPTEGLVGGESGALNVDAVAAGLKLAKAYADLGVTTFTEFLESAKTFVGDVAGVTTDTLRASWEQAQVAGYIPRLQLDPADAKAIARTAKRLTRTLVESGITERDAVVDGVFAELKQAVPEITRRQVMDAMSGYGQYAELAKGEVEAAIRDIKGQLQQLAKLEDMQAGQPPKKTGVERRTPSDAERRLIQQVNEAKRRGGFNVTDPAVQLKSALDAAKTAMRNRIADLELEISTGKRIVKEKTELIPDEELTELRKQRDELTKAHAEMFPRQPISDEQLAQRTEKALDRSIAQLESELKVGALYPEKTKRTVTSPAIEAKRAQLEALKQHRQELRDIQNPKLTPEERQLASYKTRLQTRLADLQRRVAEGDFSKVVRKETPLDKEALDLKWEIQQEQDKYKALEEKWKKSQLEGLAKAWDKTGEASNLIRAVWTSFDQSAMFRQAGPLVKAHPIIAMFTVPEAIRAFVSKKSAFQSAEYIRNHPMAQLARNAGLAITLTQGQLTMQEEAFRGSWAAYIPGVAGSERSFVTFLNKMRIDTFSALVDTLGDPSGVTSDEARIIANFVNVFTGRGHFTGANAAGAQLMSTYFFSPRLVASRFQTILGQPLWHKAGKGSLRVRKLIAQEYAKALIGHAVMTGLIIMAGTAVAWDDEDKPLVELDPRSSEFGKIRFGDTLLDPLGGLAQVTTFLARMLSGKTKMATGELVPIRGDDVPHGGMTTWDVATNFGRSKLAPVPSLVLNVAVGEDMVGNKTTVGTELAKTLVPLTGREITDAMQAKGIPKKIALSIGAMFGMGLANYNHATPEAFAKKIAQHPQLRGVNKETGEKYDYREEVDSIVLQAKKRGITAQELGQALIPYMRGKNNTEATINDWMGRLYSRYNAVK